MNIMYNVCLKQKSNQLNVQEEMELTLVGLQHAGKTTFVNVIASGSFNEDMIPTVGFNMRKISKGSVTIKLWDIGKTAHVMKLVLS